MSAKSNEEIIALTEVFVKQTLENAEGGHDWWHILRVWNNAKNIAITEGGDGFVIELAALLHDIADAKFHGGNEEIGPIKARQFLESLAVEEAVIQHVESIIRHISFKGGNFAAIFSSPELAIVQDADRLDAIGAIGIARTFNYGGFKNRTIYDPSVPPVLAMSKAEYKSNSAPTINHFYEKLLLLKDRMNTETGRKMAAQRHEYMEQFLAQFYLEWAGEK